MGAYKIMNVFNKKIMIIVIIFFMFVGLISVIYFIFNNQNNNIDPSKDPALTLTYVDPGTGLTVITTPNKIPENTGDNNITILGLSSLIDDYGMTLEQVKDLRLKYNSYSSTLKSPINELSITLSSIEVTTDSNTGYTTLIFTTTINRSSTIKSQVSYFGIGDPNLKIYDPKTNNILYSSI